jgi:hypothetical protein
MVCFVCHVPAMKLLQYKPDLCENKRCKARTIEEMEPCVNYQKSVCTSICKHIVAGRYNGGECRIDYTAKEVIEE